MAFDEQGQADTLERKVEICERAYQDTDPTGRLQTTAISSSTPTFLLLLPVLKSTTNMQSIS
jgi:cobalamin-dependent methionine synthase I